MHKKIKLITLSVIFLLTGCGFREKTERAKEVTTEEIIAESSGEDLFYDINEGVKSSETATFTDSKIVLEINDFDYSLVPEYSGEPFIIINNDKPFFAEEDSGTECYRDYGSLDILGRTMSSVMITCYEELPTGERGEIGHIKPSGWNQNKYEGIVDSEPPYLYNRSHLLMWAMIGDESNIPENLITGTRYFNTEGMYPNEEIVLNYIKNTENHVLYRVTPYYMGNNLLADGVLMEAKSIEDNGESLSMCRWVYNVQPGIKIEYKTGENYANE